jgi:hypothetical protein
MKVETGYYGNLTRLETFAAEIPVFSPASGVFGLFFALRLREILRMDSGSGPV